jgi:AcrR family transcriptional regulator
MKRKKSYHHGDLRQALVTAGLALLEEDGIEGLTLRRVARAAGVSHAAPAHHFATLKALLTALAVIGFERFGEAMRAECGRAGSDPEARMRAAGRGYVDFAAGNPGLFRLMFSIALLDWEDAALRNAAQATFRQLEEIAEPMTRVAAELGGPLEVIKLVWCSVHGYAHLYLEGQMQWLERRGRGGAPSAPRPPDIARLLALRDRGSGRRRGS